MGRGRAKAKQTKVARELKYRPVDTDFQSLERELRSGRDDDPFRLHDDPSEDVAEELEDDDEYDEYADLAAKYADPDEGEDLRKSG